jgi:hypothetical protein
MRALFDGPEGSRPVVRPEPARGGTAIFDTGPGTTSMDNPRGVCGLGPDPEGPSPVRRIEPPPHPESLLMSTPRLIQVAPIVARIAALVLVACSCSDRTENRLPGATGGRAQVGVDGTTAGCHTGQTLCASACVDLNIDSSHCGACGVVCVTGQSCIAGACECQVGLTQCSGACTNPATDALNCGACGVACVAGQVCSAGTCSTTCSVPGQTMCAASCVDLSTDVFNCGSCESACSAGQSCVGGTCTCPAGQSACDGQCVTTATDPHNCGTCGIVCTAEQTCSNGICMDDAGTGGTATASEGTGGASTGGAATGGAATGGVATGGVATGGVATGEGATGGAATGGAATGGAAGTGGAATGGAADTGGSSATEGDELLVPESGALLGGFIGTGTIEATESQIGRQWAIHLQYFDWPSDFISFARSDIEAGRIPYITWEPWSVTLEAIASGSQDATIRARAEGIAALGGTVMLRFAHEMNGNWYPWDGFDNGGDASAPPKYVAAYRHVCDVFANAGVTNVLWVFCPNVDSVPNESWNNWENYYPGDEYVDWMCYDSYDWGGDTFASMTSRIYSEIATKNKPIMLGETSTQEVEKAAWINAIIPAMQSEFPMIRGLVWFHVDKENDWRYDSTQSSLDAFIAMANDPYFNP